MLDTDSVWANGDKTREGDLKQQDETIYLTEHTATVLNTLKFQMKYKERPNIPPEYRIVFYVKHVLTHIFKAFFWMNLSPISVIRIQSLT